MSGVLSHTSLAVCCNVCLAYFVPIKHAFNDNGFVILTCLPDGVWLKMHVVCPMADAVNTRG